MFRHNQSSQRVPFLLEAGRLPKLGLAGTISSNPYRITTSIGRNDLISLVLRFLANKHIVVYKNYLDGNIHCIRFLCYYVDDLDNDVKREIEIHIFLDKTAQNCSILEYIKSAGTSKCNVFNEIFQTLQQYIANCETNPNTPVPQIEFIQPDDTAILDIEFLNHILMRFTGRSFIDIEIIFIFVMNYRNHVLLYDYNIISILSRYFLSYFSIKTERTILKNEMLKLLWYIAIGVLQLSYNELFHEQIISSGIVSKLFSYIYLDVFDNRFDNQSKHPLFRRICIEILANLSANEIFIHKYSYQLKMIALCQYDDIHMQCQVSVIRNAMAFHTLRKLLPKILKK